MSSFIKYLGLIATLTPLTAADFAMTVYPDDNCQNEIISMNCLDIYDTCTPLSPVMSYSFTNEGDPCGAAGNGLWNVIAPSQDSGCSNEWVGAGCGGGPNGLSCQKTHDGSDTSTSLTPPQAPGLRAMCLETFNEVASAKRTVKRSGSVEWTS